MDTTKLRYIYENQITPREREVLDLFLAVKSDKKISTDLNMTEATVRQHLSNICKKFSDNEPKPIGRTELMALRTELMALSGYRSNFIPTDTKIRGDVPSISEFFGRTDELQQLQQWILDEQCRLVALLGMGGIGKTTLAAKLVEQISDKFEYVIWQSLRVPRELEELLTILINFLSNQLENKPQIFDNLGSKISQLIEYFRNHRCLVVLDNIESIMQGHAGCYQPGYEAYSELLRQIWESDHQSCLVITSRESPNEITSLGKIKHIRFLSLSGLQVTDGQKIFGEFNSCSPQDWQELIEYYGGNPLHLQIVGAIIRDTLNGNISQFISEYLKSGYCNQIRELFLTQFNRLSDLEKEIIYWLVINRETVCRDELKQDIVGTELQREFIDSLLSLKRRSFIEDNVKGYALQPVIMKYATEKFLQQIIAEIKTGEIGLIESHALIKSNSKEYIRDTQIELFIKPVLKILTRHFGSQAKLEQHLYQMLSQLQNEAPNQPDLRRPGYAGGNLLNLYRYLGTDFSACNFSDLTIRQADLRDIKLQGVSFGNSHFEKCLFSSPLGSILWVVFSPSGRLLAAGDVNGNIYLWQVRQDEFGHALLEPHATLGGESWVWTIRFSPDEKYLASAGDEHDVKIWHLETQTLLGELSGHTGSIKSLSFNQQGMLASASDDKTIKLWQIETGECIRTLYGHEAKVRSVSFHPQNPQIIASAGDDKTVRLWTITTGEFTQVFHGHTGDIRTVCFSPNGQFLASAGNDKTVRLWHVSNGECLVLEGHQNWVRSVDFSPNGQFLLSASEDQTVKLWNVNSSNCIRTFQEHSSWVQSVRFSPDGNGKTFASGSTDRTVKLWDVNQGCITTIAGYTNCLFAVAFSPDGQTLASGHEDKIIRLWNLQTLQHETLQGHTGWVRSVTFSANGKLLASSSGDRTVRLWNFETGECKVFAGHENWIRQVRFSPNNRFLASCSDDRKIKIWDIATEKCIQTLSGHQGWVRSIAFTADGKLLASAGGDGTVKIWHTEDIHNVRCIQTLHDHRDWVWSVAFAPDGQILASAGGDDTVRIWRVNADGQWENVRILRGHTKSVRTVAFSADGRLLASGSIDRLVLLWDTCNWQPLGHPKEHSDWVRSVAFSSTGLLASASQDGIIQLWNIQQDECKILRLPNIYEGMDVRSATGLTSLQKASLKALGAKVT